MIEGERLMDNKLDLTTDHISHLFNLGSRTTMEGRWVSFGPYYAMFPVEFALNVIHTYSNVGDHILDPFSGRGTTLFAASMLDRLATGIDINPLGWLYASAKLNPASLHEVKKRLHEIALLASEKYVGSHKEYDEFFHLCYSTKVLDFLIAAREELQWKTKKVDRTLMAFLTVELHGKQGSSLSNQMQLVKACGPNYAINWWKKNGLTPPEIDPVDLMTRKLEWRYAKGTPSYKDAKIHLGDSTKLLSTSKVKQNKHRLLFTSPPYAGVTDYFVDQWLRLWLLGGAPEQKTSQALHRNRFVNKQEYSDLLYDVFSKSKKSLTDDATIYVRTDARQFTRDTTIEILKELFPEKTMEVIHRPFTKRTQTALHGDNSAKPGETDIILTA